MSQQYPVKAMQVMVMCCRIMAIKAKNAKSMIITVNNLTLSKNLQFKNNFAINTAMLMHYLPEHEFYSPTIK